MMRQFGIGPVLNDGPAYAVVPTLHSRPDLVPPSPHSSPVLPPRKENDKRLDREVADV
ncbi:MAG: hypothetical protein OJF50_006475 [Nitrospira sp.]|nr:hypothetical protein [Nitrospira sp.]